jgi:hypothetical protein
MATFIEEQKRQKRLFYLLIIVLVLIGLVLWFGFLRKPRANIEEVAKRVLGPEVEFKKVEIDLTLLENPLLKEFQLFEKISPLEEKIGRENPFIPY